MSGEASAVVIRNYRESGSTCDACAQAVRLLLNFKETKQKGRSASGPDDVCPFLRSWQPPRQLRTGQFAGEAVMGLYNRVHIDRGDLPVFHDDPTVDDRVPRLLRRAEHGGRDRVVQRAGIIDRVQVDAEEICAHPGGQRADIRAAQHGSTAAGRDL